MISLEIKNIATITVEGIYYCCVIHDVSKSDAISLLKGSAPDDKKMRLKGDNIKKSNCNY